jgi:tetratricopeptide (TPR) repeat protein
LDREEVQWEAPDPLVRVPGAVGSFDYLPTGVPNWEPLVRLPERTTDTFTGREAEIAKLWDWYNDEGNRACLVYGDGGIGKTTLVMEFLWRVLEGRLGVPSWQPALMSFYSAKNTRWGVDGLEAIRFGVVGLADAVLETARTLEGGSLDREWYSTDAGRLPQKFATYLSETWSIKREQHLIILDNTETLAQDQADVQRLGEHIRELSRRAGRVILTSRRREVLNAEPIEVAQLSTDEAVDLLVRRAGVLRRAQLLNAKRERVRECAELLERRPLVLDVLIQTLSEASLSLDKAVTRVRNMQARDLGEFLYADAWARFAEEMKVVLLLMTRISDAHEEASIRLSCQAYGVAASVAEEALQESHGIAKVAVIAGQRLVTFRRGFLDFCRNRTVQRAGRAEPAPEIVQRVKQEYEQLLRIRDKQVSDRMSRAYRKPFAKMAWSAYQQNRDDDCESYYELAVAEDPDNGLLFDRYAFFLLRRKNAPEMAYDKAVRATDLSPENGDVWFTRGRIEGLLNRTDDALRSFQRSLDLGKPQHLVLLQVGHCNFRAKPQRLGAAALAVRKCQQLAPSSNDPKMASYLAELDAIARRIRLQGADV